MINVEAIGLNTLQAKLKILPEKFRAELYKRMIIQSLNLKSYIQKDELSGQLLKVKTGDLRDSIAQEVHQDSNSVMARVFSSGNLAYARPLNDGCGPYDIKPKNGKALMFDIGGKTVFAKVVHHPGQKPRHYMELGLGHQKPEIIAAIQGSLKGAWA